MPANGGLLALNPDDQPYIDPSFLLAATTAEPTDKADVAPPSDQGPQDQAPPPAPATAAPPSPPPDGQTKPADGKEEPGLWERIRHGIGQVGWVLGGGDPGLANLSPEQQQTAGSRALLNMGLAMLSRSGPSMEPRNFGQILAGGLAAAGEVPTREEALVAQQGATQQELALKRAQLGIAGMTAQARLQLLRLQLAQVLGGQKAADDALRRLGYGGTSTATPGGLGAPIARDPNAPTIGQQANNPGNVMADGGLPPGATGYIVTGNGRKVAAYPDLTTGIAANAANLAAYATQHGISTVHDAVSRWVDLPHSPGLDITSYENDIAKALGVKPTDKIDLTDPKVQTAFILAQQPHETGKLWFTPADVQAGVQRAQEWRQGKNLPTTQTAAAAPATPAPATPAPPAAPAIQQGGAVPPPPGTGPAVPAAAGAYPEAGGGIGRVLTDTQGVPGRAQVTVAPPPVIPSVRGPAGRLQTTGKPPGVAMGDQPNPVLAALEAGRAEARATPMPPGTVMAAGPGAGTPPGAAEAPWAPSAQSGNYNATPPAAPAPATPPPPAPAPPAAGTPAPASTTTAPVTPQPPPVAQDQGSLAAQQLQTQLGAIQASRQKLREAAAARIIALRGSGGPNVAQQVSEVESNLNTEDAKLDAEARGVQAKIDDETRTYNRSIAEKNLTHQQAVELAAQQAAAAQALEAQRAANDLQRTREGALLADDTDRLKEGRAKANAATSNLMTIQQLRALEPSIGETNPAMAENPQLFDTIYNGLGLGSVADRSQEGAQRAYTQLINQMVANTKPTGLGQISDKDRQFIQDMAPSLAQTHDGRMLLLGMSQVVAERTLAMHNFSEDFIHNPQNHGSSGPGNGGKTLNQELNDRFQSKSLFDTPPAFVKGATEQNSADYRAYVLSHVDRPGVPFIGLAPDGKTRVLMMYDNTRPVDVIDAASGQRVTRPRLVAQFAGKPLSPKD